MKKTQQTIWLGMICGLLLLPSVLWAGNDSTDTTGKPAGKAIITIFSDIHSGFGAVNDDRGFSLERAYLGYQYKLPKGVELKAVADFGRMKELNEYQRVGFIKNALVSWKYKKWTVNAGLISTTQFKLQEDFWGKRYVMKSFQDEYKMGSSADLAVSVAYRFNPLVAADIIVANGEGYKKLQVKDGLQYGGGVTVNPFSSLTLRVYGAYNEPSEPGASGVINLASFAGYRQSGFSLAVEYNHQFNSKYVGGQDMNGVSVYSSVELGKKVGLFGRWDYLNSKDCWNIENDGMAAVLGAEFKLGKYIRLAPNFRLRTYRSSETSDACYVYLNASFAI